MRYRLIWTALMGWTLVMGIGVSAWPMPTTLVVDDDGQAAVGDCDATVSTYSTIQSAINAASPGDTVFVCPGTYAEQVTIQKPGVTLEGSGIDQTVVKPGTLSLTASSLFSGQPLAYIILVDGVSGVTIKNLTVDGSGVTNASDFCDPRGFIGIFYRASRGTITGVKVTSIKEPLGCQNHLGIFVQSGYGPHLKSDVTITDSTVEDYGKNGITCNEAGTRCIVAGNTVTGIGPTDVIGQNGIQLGFGAHGRVLGNTVSGNVYTPEPVTACGILIFRAGGTVSGNTFASGDNEQVLTNETNICNSAGVEMPEHPFKPVEP